MDERHYFNSLKASWHFVWRHKVLWAFGLLAATLGQMGVVDFLVKIAKVGTDDVSIKWLLFPSFLRSGNYGDTLFASFQSGLISVILITLLVALFGFILFAALSSQGAIIHSFAQLMRGKDDVDASTAWHAGVGHAGRLFVLNLVKKIVILLSGALVSILVLVNVVDFSALNFVLFLFGFLLACLLGLLSTILTIYAAGYVVIEEQGLKDALKNAWRLFLKHWLVSLEIGVVILCCEILVILVAIWGIAILFLPGVFIWILSLFTFSSTLWIAGSTVSIILSTIFVMILGAIFTVFATGVWTYLFMKMHQEGIVSRVMSVFHRS